MTRNERLYLMGAGATHVGRVRKTNQDTFIVSPELDLYAVMDGMGGHRGGELAARIARDHLLEYVQLRSHSSSDPCELITSAIESASRTVYAAGKRSVRYAGMGTTVVACQFSPPNRLAIAHAGDSRAYRLRSGHLEALTTDHNQAQEWLSKGVITAEEAARSEGRHMLSRSLGHEDGVTPDVDMLTLEPGDRVLLCSDGLHGQVTSDVLRDVLGSGEEPETIAQALIDVTLAGDALDNVTAVVVVVEAQPSTRRAPSPHSERDRPADPGPLAARSSTGASRDWRRSREGEHAVLRRPAGRSCSL